MPRQPARASSGRYVSRLTGGTLAIIMAGGRGERLRDLTAHRCKPATPFGGKFRIIDFVLSNCVNSGIRQISILTQYKTQSLIQHVQYGWGYLRGEFGEFIEVVPAQQQLGPVWYRGTADAVHQNIELIVSHRPKHVFAYPFQDVKTRAQSYWRDVGTIDAYYEANLELVHVRPELNIYDEDWPIWTYQGQRPPAKFILDEDGRRGMAVNSMVSGG